MFNNIKKYLDYLLDINNFALILNISTAQYRIIDKKIY
jgi:hypothetical protein